MMAIPVRSDDAGRLRQGSVAQQLWGTAVAEPAPPPDSYRVHLNGRAAPESKGIHEMACWQRMDKMAVQVLTPQLGGKTTSPGSIATTN